MLPAVIVFIAIAAVVIFWTVYTQRRLVRLDENICNTMILIGVQLSNQFDALMFLLELIKEYAQSGSETLIGSVRSGRCMIMARSTPEDVLEQEEVITEVLGRIAALSEQYPEIKAARNYIRAMDAIQALGNMRRTSRMIYNDNVTKLNHQIQMFPTSVIANISGLRQRDYLPERKGK